jgi:hypothetical protein
MLNVRNEQILKTLTQSLVAQIDKKRIISNGFDPNSVLYDIFNLNNNRKSKLFQASSEVLIPENMRDLIEKGLVQELDISGTMRYTLSFKGLVTAIELFYGASRDDQFNNFLKLSDERYKSTTITGELNWREKLAIITLLTLGCVSQNTAMNLNNPLNREHFEKLLEDNIIILENYKVFEKHYELPQTRGEPKATLFMRSRINDLSRKTNHIYRNLGGGEGYYLDILSEESVDPEKTKYLLTRIFERYDPEIEYTALKNALTEKGRTHQSKFLSVSFNSRNIIQIISILDDFFERDIWNLT